LVVAALSPNRREAHALIRGEQSRKASSLSTARRYDEVMVDTAVWVEPDTDDGVLRVLIVDDHAVVRSGTRQVLETSEHITVVGEADDGAGALALVDGVQPDLVLIDVQLPEQSGIDVARRLGVTHPDVRVLMLSAHDDEGLVQEAMEVGAAGYLLKTIPRDELIGAVRAAGHGTTVMDPALSSRFAGTTGNVRRATGSRLTWREQQAVELVADGLSNKAVAVRMVEGHLNHAFAKLGIESRTELVRMVLTGGLT
jgi:DNA-binding NarL/FixJ family response regulator